MTEKLNIALVFGAGLASVLSPCVLPVIPIIVTGSHDDHRLRPVMIIAGLTLTFVVMGAISSLFGTIIGPKMYYVNKAAGVLIVLFGLLLIFNVNLFKHLGFLSQFAQKSRGKAGGFILGLTLGIIWIPCVGPLLSSVLALVASHAKVLYGIFFLLIYSLGFAVPMLIAGFAAQFFRNRFRKIGKFPAVVNVASGLILVAFGVAIFFKGSFGFGF
jgi:cytochrome c-type biogenesis protein